MELANLEELQLLLSNFAPICICLHDTALGAYDHPLPEVIRLFTLFNFPIHLQRTYTMCSIYLPPSTPIAREDLVSLIRQLPFPSLILGDFNGRHTLWGDTIVNPRGDLIASIIEEMDLGIFNTGDNTHYHVQTNTTTVIDLSLCSADSLMDFEWRVTDNLKGSDHYPILLSSSEVFPTPRVPCWRLDKVDWELYKKLVKVDRSIEESPSVDEAVDYIATLLGWNNDGSSVVAPQEVTEIFHSEFAGVSSMVARFSEFKWVSRVEESQTLYFGVGRDETYNIMFSMKEMRTALSLTGDTSP
ncbi:RNA-directed DNA polymerase from transposon BS-like 1, partial [Homarus americanus]